MGGHRDEARAREWEHDTLVPVFSATKGMTAVCAHQLAEGGALDLDAPVAQYWPEFAASGKDALPVRWLLTHQAGLPAVREPLPPGSLYDWQRMCSALAAQEPWWTPGTKHGYHITTFGYLVGEVVRRITGESLGTHFRHHVAQPLGVDFHIGLPAQLEARTSDIHGSFGGAPAPGRPAPNAEGGAAETAAMLRSVFTNPPQKWEFASTREWRGAEIPSVNGIGNARALSRIYGALARGGELDGVRLLQSQTIAQAIEEQVYGPDAVLFGRPTRFGLGFALRHDGMPMSPNARAFGHSGNGGSMGMADPDAKVGFGYVVNRMHAGPEAFSAPLALVDAFYRALR